MFQQCMAEQLQRDRAIQPRLPTSPEQAVPVVRIPQRQQRGITHGNDHPAFVEVRHRILGTRTQLRPHAGNFMHLPQVQRLLQCRITQPYQGIEQVMPVVFTGSDLTTLGNPLFVVQAVSQQGRRLRHEALRHALRQVAVEHVDGRPCFTLKQVGVLVPRRQRQPTEHHRVDRAAGRRDIAHVRT